MNLKIKVDGKEFQIGCSTLENGIYGFPDTAEYSGLFYKLAMSPSSKIINDIAGKENIDKETISILLNDTQLCVLMELVENYQAAKSIPEDELIRLIELDDSELCSAIASRVEYFELCDPRIISEKLMTNDGSVVRGSLAENRGTPKHIIRKLIKDIDADVAQKARYTLS